VSAITKTAASVSTSTEHKKGGGNPTKQIQLRFSAKSLPTLGAVRGLIILGSPRVFVLTWNPTVWGISDDQLEQTIAITSTGGVEQATWSTGNRKSGISPGDHVVLFRQHAERGIIAHGIATSEIWQEQHFNNSSKRANYVSVLWTEWVSTEDRLPVEELQALSTETDWNALMTSGIQLPAEDAAAILDAWGVDDTEEETTSGDPEEEGLPEGARTTVKVNRYERNLRARKRCLKEHGTACKVCSIDFGQAYSGIADGFIHVHHLVPIASIGKEYRLDPVEDLVPVCPNCHAMLHYGANPPRSVEELRSLLGL
jgi:5-methylcytosine-specific restriction protein A